jgi:hypothetical protein
MHDKCLVKVENALNLWVEDMIRKCVQIDGNMLSQEVLSLYKNFSKGFSETSDTKSGVSLDWKVQKFLEMLLLLLKFLPHS